MHETRQRRCRGSGLCGVTREEEGPWWEGLAAGSWEGIGDRPRSRRRQSPEPRLQGCLHIRVRVDEGVGPTG